MEFYAFFGLTMLLSAAAPFAVKGVRALWWTSLDAFPSVARLKAELTKTRADLNEHLLSTAQNENERLVLKRKLAFVHLQFLEGNLMPPHRVEIQRVLLRMAASLNCPHGSPDHRVDYCNECVDLQYGKRGSIGT